jgi:hypothetical protein
MRTTGACRGRAEVSSRFTPLHKHVILSPLDCCLSSLRWIVYRRTFDLDVQRSRGGDKRWNFSLPAFAQHPATTDVAVAPQYDTTHVYVAPEDFDRLIGRPNDSYRRIRIESKFGRVEVHVTDGHLTYPYGKEVTGYEVTDLRQTLEKARGAGGALSNLTTQPTEVRRLCNFQEVTSLRFTPLTAR